MAPELDVLRRKRSRPSDWWAVVPSPSITTPPAKGPPPKKRDRTSYVEGNGGISDKPAAGNRGKSVKGKAKAIGGANEEKGDANELEGDAMERVKPVRRGRSSGGDKELRVIDTMAIKGSQKGAKGNKGAAGGQRAPEGAPEIVDYQPTQKKRGHPAIAQGEEENENFAQAEFQAAPRKRGRPAQKQAEEENQPILKQRARPITSQPTSTIVDVTAKDTIPRRKGRSSNTETGLRVAVNYKETKTQEYALSTDAEVEVQADAGSNLRPELPVGRGRSSNTEAGLQAAFNYKRPKTVRRGPPLDTPAKLPVAVASQSGDQAKSQKRERRPAPESDLKPVKLAAGQNMNRRRPRRPEDNGDVQVASSRLSKSQADSKKSVKPVVEARSEARMGSSKAQNSEGQKRRGRQYDSNVLGGVDNLPAQAKQKRLERSSQAETKGQKRKKVENDRTQTAKRRRMEKVVQEIRTEKAPGYQHLSAVTRRVSRTTIDAKWDSLPPPCVERISQLVQDIQRPVVVRLNDERKRTQASTALQMISRRLVTKISKGIPFPQGARNHREDDFDFEKILDYNRGFESQLTTALHTNELLEAELAKELAWFESEQSALAELEINAKAESSKRRQDGRKLHLLLQSGSSSEEDLDNDIGFRSGGVFRPLNLNLRKDENLQDVVKELHGHVESIDGNMKQVNGITEVMAKSKAAVQATLFEYFDSAQYQEVVLG